MTFKRPSGKALRLATFTLLGAVLVSGCIQSVDYYDDEYNGPDRTVIVRHDYPAYQNVYTYEPRPTIIYAEPAPMRHHHHSRPYRTTEHVVVKPHYYNNDKTIILNPGKHQQQRVIIKGDREEQNTTVIKSYRNNVGTHHYNKTHTVSPPSTTEVQHTKKIVIESHGEAPPSTLAE